MEGLGERIQWRDKLHKGFVLLMYRPPDFLLSLSTHISNLIESKLLVTYDFKEMPN